VLRHSDMDPDPDRILATYGKYGQSASRRGKTAQGQLTLRLMDLPSISIVSKTPSHRHTCMNGQERKPAATSPPGSPHIME
jgi:hypothetical protein